VAVALYEVGGEARFDKVVAAASLQCCGQL
jgi:hypothetical protein